MLKSMLLAIALTLPLALSATSPSAGAAPEGARLEPTSPGQYLCCWIFIYGRWMCIPC